MQTHTSRHRAGLGLRVCLSLLLPLRTHTEVSCKEHLSSTDSCFTRMNLNVITYGRTSRPPRPQPLGRPKGSPAPKRGRLFWVPLTHARLPACSCPQCPGSVPSQADEWVALKPGKAFASGRIPRISPPLSSLPVLGMGETSDFFPHPPPPGH